MTEFELANGSVVPVTPTNPLPTTAYNGGTLTNRSGTITAGGTSQQIAPANASRKYLFIQNPITATETLFVNFGSPAASGTSYEIAAGGSLSLGVGSFVPTDAVNIVAATTGHVFVAKEG